MGVACIPHTSTAAFGFHSGPYSKAFPAQDPTQQRPPLGSGLVQPLKGSFYYTVWVISTTLASRLLIRSSVSSNFLIPSGVFSFKLLYSSSLINSFFYIFQLFVEVHTVFTHPSPEFDEHPYDHYFITLNFLWVDFVPIPFSSFFSGFISLVCLEHIPFSPHFAYISVFVSMY